jgi:catechol 2,3-dioxygenase-like lactoylglutathione lyase family enzyme
MTNLGKNQTSIRGIDHVAIVTTSLSEAKRFYGRLGLRLSKVFDVKEQFPEEPKPHRYRAFAVLFEDQGPVLWVMQPVSAGPLRRFVKHRGPGLHHVALRVKRMLEEDERLRKSSIRLIRRTTVFKKDREIRALIDPSKSNGVLIELVERLPKP